MAGLADDSAGLRLVCTVMTSLDSSASASASRRLIVTQNVTVDGSIEMLGPWFSPEAENDQDDLIEEMAKQDATSDAIVFGRQTFEDMRGYWPKQTDDRTGVTATLNRVTNRHDNSWSSDGARRRTARSPIPRRGDPMGRVVVVNLISIDGVIQSPLSPTEDRDGGFEQGGWVPPYSDDIVNDFMQQATSEAAGTLLGRRSYQILTDAWSEADDSEPAVAAMNQMPTYVVSSTPGDLPWTNSRWIGSNLGQAVTALKNGTNGDLVVFGAATLVRGLAEHDLVDDYRLLVFPIILGAGKRMFDDHGQPARFTLTDNVVSPSGVAILTYTRDNTA